MGLQPLDTTPVPRLLRSAQFSFARGWSLWVMAFLRPKFGSARAPLWPHCDQATLEESEGRKAAAILKIQIEIICAFQPVIPH